MPNTLVHIAVQVPASRIAFRGVPAALILVACVIPDLPWILRRALRVAFPDIDPVWLMQYAAVQSTLLFCLVFCAAIAAFARRHALVWTVLAINCLVHLLIDAVEIKPGNGVLLLAPFRWEHVSLSLIWPESPIITILSIVGIFVGLAVLVLMPANSGIGTDRPALRVALLALFLGLYLLAPGALVRGPFDADFLSMRALAEASDRPGRTVRFDRRPYIKTRDGDYIVAFTGERFRVIGNELPDSGWVSGSGEFVDEHIIEARQLHQSRAGLRDFASYAGLSIILLVWIRVGWQLRRSGPEAAEPQ